MTSRKRPSTIWELYRSGGLGSAVTSMFNLQNAQHMAFVRSIVREERRTILPDTPIADIPFVIFDVETTGFHPHAGDEVISIGAIAAQGGQMEAKSHYYSLVNPGRTIPDAIVALTGITNEMAASAPDGKTVLQTFLQFASHKVLIAHGTSHDKQFLNHMLWRTSRVRLPHRILDTVHLAKWLHPELLRYDLDTLLGKYRIPIINRHHALGDARMTAMLWNYFTLEMKERHIVTLSDLYAQLSLHA